MPEADFTLKSKRPNYLKIIGGMKIFLLKRVSIGLSLHLMECKVLHNKKTCACSYGCPKSGICCECVRYHRERRQLPACFFTKEAEKTYDRSFEHFVKLVGEGKI